MTAGVPTIGGLKRLSNYMAGQLKSAVNITGGTISGVSISSSTLVNTVTAGTTATAFTSNGTTTFGSTAAKTFTMVAPVAGVSKLLDLNVTTTATQTIDISPAVIGLPSSSLTKILMVGTADQIITLSGLSTSRWALIGQNSTLTTLTT